VEQSPRCPVCGRPGPFDDTVPRERPRCTPLSCSSWKITHRLTKQGAKPVRSDGRADLGEAATPSPQAPPLNVPLARVLLERAQDGYVNPTGGKTTGRERKDA
jgi:hypothetical protein